MIERQRTQEGRSVLRDTVVTETSRSGCTAFRSDTPRMTVRLDSERFEQPPHLFMFPFILERNFASFLPTEKCPGDIVRPLMPPPVCNDPPVLHFEQEKLSLRCNKIQENNDQRVRFCWTLSNRNWAGAKENPSLNNSFKFELQIKKWILFIHPWKYQKVTVNSDLRTGT